MKKTISNQVESALDIAVPNVLPTKAGYDRWSEIYDSEENPLVLLEELHIGSLIGNVGGLQVVDIGCGTGRHALSLAAAGATVTAVDFSEAMLERARVKPGADRVRFVLHDLAEPLPFAGDSFDLVVSCLVGDHMADLSSYFGELKRLCRTGGRVVFSVMHPALLLRGVQARFIDPDTGERVMPLSYPYQIADYVMAAIGAGLLLEHLSEYSVDATLAGRSPRAEKYLGWPMLMMMRFR